MQWGNSSEGVRELRPGDQCWAQNLNSSDVFETAGHVAFDLVTLGVEKLTMSLVGYRFATMTLLTVDEVVSVNVAKLGAKNSTKDTTLRLVQEFDRPNRKRKRQNREPAAKTKAVKKVVAAGSEGDSSDNESSGEHSRSAASSSASSSTPPAPVDPVPPPPDPPVVGVALSELPDEVAPSDIELAIAEATAEHDLKFSEEDCQVRDRDNNIVGRITRLHKDTNKEAVSCYCRLHQCTAPLMRAHRAPPHSTYLQWLSRGRDLARGKESQGAHMALWRELMR